MSEPRRDPETGGRSLADILREAGVESPRSGRRRPRSGDTGETPIRQRGSGGDTGRVAERPAFGRRAGDRADATGGTPTRDRATGDRATGDRATGDTATPAPGRGRGRHEPSTAAIPGLRPSRKPGVPVTAGTGSRASGATPSTGPIPVVRAQDDPPLLEDEALGPREGALAWLRFAGELVVALGTGVGTYFLFTVLWELLPWLAVVLAPVVVAGLVGAVGAWRQRQDKEPADVRLVAVLVFAGTLLTIAPAAGLLSGT
ncbi:hypothetical protein [Geodermatophilus marinus]|uniref:hypothetical protein n=1 Tax=Geodermatophilus sp. LHW52908 TaxID=2303986 RepID=UPI000E3E940E|nr:hypothetical protein [Geodermatophilus sp. LHW52908]RFU23291.1 hypothetical protein D0Z06_01200 [Geodermatophilus sp. LHW52908]